MDLLAVQGTLKSSPALQFKSINSLAFSLLCGPALTSTGKTIALTRLTFAGKVMSLLFNTLPRFFIGFLPRNKYVLISWLQSLSAVILEHVFFRVFKIDRILWKSKTGRCHLRRSSRLKEVLFCED